MKTSKLVILATLAVFAGGCGTHQHRAMGTELDHKELIALAAFAEPLPGSFARLELAETKVKFAESEVEVATFRYRRGLANNLDVVNAELAALTAQNRMLGTRAEFAVARLRLLAALGILRPREDI